MLKLVHPERYEVLKTTFRNLSEQSHRYSDVRFAAYIRYEADFKFEPDVFSIPVSRVRMVGLTRTADAGYFRIAYRIEESRFWLWDITFERQGEVSSERLD